MLNNCTPRLPITYAQATAPLKPQAQAQPVRSPAGPLVVKAPAQPQQASWFDTLHKYAVLNPLVHAGWHFWAKVVPTVANDVGTLWGALMGQKKPELAPLPAVPVAETPVAPPRDPKAEIGCAFYEVFGWEMTKPAEKWYMDMYRGGKNVCEIRAWMVRYKADIERAKQGR